MSVYLEGYGERNPDVKFSARMRGHNNECCDCCFGVTSVVILRYPETKRHNGRSISTKYHEMWICEECLEKMKYAITHVEEAKK